MFSLKAFFSRLPRIGPHPENQGEAQMIHGNQDHRLGEATLFAIGGASLGAIAAGLGPVGVAAGLLAFVMGAGPVMMAGAVAGLAAFGLKQTMAE